jgi:cation diffusion facilitator family transporter
MEKSNNFVQNADRLAVLTAVVLVGFGVTQIIFGETISKSVALVANGIDCIGDGFVSAIVWIGLRFFRRPADHKFHYGYYKMENLASIGAAGVMLVLAAYVIFRSYNQFINPVAVQLPLIGIFVALAAAIVALALGVYKYIRGKKSKMSSVKLDAFNTVKDGTTSSLTVVALILSSFGFYVADAIVGFIIAGIIVSIGFAAIKESSYMLVDACDGYCMLQGGEIRKIVEGVKGVKSVQVVRLRRAGPFVQGEIDIIVSPEMPVKELDKIRKKIIESAKGKYPEIDRLTVTAIPDGKE